MCHTILVRGIKIDSVHRNCVERVNGMKDRGFWLNYQIGLPDLAWEAIVYTNEDPVNINIDTKITLLLSFNALTPMTMSNLVSMLT